MGFFGIGEKSTSPKFQTMVRISPDGMEKFQKHQVNSREYDVLSAMNTLHPCTNANEIAKSLGGAWSETKVFDVLVILKDKGYIEKTK
jgi:hypothetical protein